MAIGAQPRQILSQLLLRALRSTAIGVALGALGALAGARLLRGLLFGIEPHDPGTFLAASLLLVAAALAAAAWPALRAARVSPMTVLQSDS